MSLVKRRELSEKQLAAIRRNQKLTHGPATAESLGRIRAAHLQHGFYAQEEEIALRSLGEEPERFQELLEGLWRTYNPSDAAQEALVIRLARDTWLMDRLDRMQEGCALRRASEVGRGRQDRLHAQIMRMKMTEDRLGRLAEAVADEHYVTTEEDLEVMKNLNEEGELKEMGEITLALFYQLQEPGTGEDGMTEEERARIVVRQVKGIFGISMPPEPKANQPLEEGRDARYPKISPGEWDARERPRQLLENILKRQVESCAALRKAAREESRKGPSPYERAAEIAPIHPQAVLIRRMQDSYFREVRKVTNLLLKIKNFERKSALLEGEDEE